MKMRYIVTGQIVEPSGKVRWLLQHEELVKEKHKFNPMEVMKGDFGGVMQQMSNIRPDSISVEREYAKKKNFKLGDILTIELPEFQ